MKRLEPEIEREVRPIGAMGQKLREIGRMLGCSRHSVTNTLCREARPPSATWQPPPARLSLDEREEIRVGLEQDETLTAIAARIGRVVSTVSREVKANGGRDAYRAHVAHQGAFERSRWPKTPKLACPRLAATVAEWLEQWWAPEQNSERLRLEVPGDPMMPG